MSLITAGLLAMLTLTPVEIVGHRGASYDAPENTLASINLGWEQGADGVEIDVYLSKDQKIIVTHDKDTRRASGVDLAIAEHTADELRKLDVGRWKGEKYAGERLPLLEEVLATIPRGKRLFIEVKCGPEIVPVLKGVLACAGRKPEETAIISFNADVIAASKKALPGLKAYWIVGLRPDKETGAWSPSLESMLTKAAEIKADGLDLSAKEVIDPAYGRKIRNAGLEFLVWTVNDPEVARKMIAAGVQGITTDRPGWLREQLERASSE